MKDAILLELAARWERDAKPPPQPAIVGTQEVLDELHQKKAREVKRQCADELRSLVALLGDAV